MIQSMFVMLKLLTTLLSCSIFRSWNWDFTDVSRLSAHAPTVVFFAGTKRVLRKSSVPTTKSTRPTYRGVRCVATMTVALISCRPANAAVLLTWRCSQTESVWRQRSAHVKLPDTCIPPTTPRRLAVESTNAWTGLGWTHCRKHAQVGDSWKT